jgi:hypothetical protein
MGIGINMKVTAVREVTPYSLKHSYQRLRAVCRLHLQGRKIIQIQYMRSEDKTKALKEPTGKRRTQKI